MSLQAPSYVTPAPVRLDTSEEDFLARMTDAAYHVALKHGFKGSFVDLQLELWSVLRNVMARHLSPRPLPASTRGGIRNPPICR
jgi:hypothetical protein